MEFHLYRPRPGHPDFDECLNKARELERLILPVITKDADLTRADRLRDLGRRAKAVRKHAENYYINRKRYRRGDHAICHRLRRSGNDYLGRPCRLAICAVGRRWWCARRDLGDVSTSENMQAMIDDPLNRLKSARGGQLPQAKLTEADIRLIRALVRERNRLRAEASELSNCKLAEKFNVHRCTIEKIISGETWAYVL